MASSGYMPLPSEPSSSGPPPAYEASPAAPLAAGYPPGVVGPAYTTPSYSEPAAAATAVYPGSYQSGAPYNVYPIGPAGVPGHQQDQQNTYVHLYQPSPSVIVIGGCPACRVGVLEDDYPCLGIFCAIAFFPLGLLCCLAMKQRHCPNCGAVFG